jgi:hypothetical protein
MWITMIGEHTNPPDIRQVVAVTDQQGRRVGFRRFADDGHTEMTPPDGERDTEKTKLVFERCFDGGQSFSIVLKFDERADDANKIEFQPTDREGVGLAGGPPVTPTTGKPLLDSIFEIVAALGGLIPKPK